jgi:hypothetical protein
MYKVLIDRQNSNEYAIVDFETACAIKGISPKPKRYCRSRADRPKVFAGADRPKVFAVAYSQYAGRCLKMGDVTIRRPAESRPLETITDVSEYVAQWRRMNHLTD